MPSEAHTFTRKGNEILRSDGQVCAIVMSAAEGDLILARLNAPIPADAASEREATQPIGDSARKAAQAVCKQFRPRFCRDCADHDGICPLDKLPCDLFDRIETVLAPYITGSSVVEGQARNYAYRESARDWTEDYPHENGRYLNHCRLCGAAFCGHKRRPTCRVCTPPAADAPQGGEGERQAFEKWIKGEFNAVDLRRDPGDDGYYFGTPHMAWLAWQARATKADAPALGLTTEELMFVNSLPEDGYGDARIRKLRAIISRLTTPSTKG